MIEACGPHDSTRRSPGRGVQNPSASLPIQEDDLRETSEGALPGSQPPALAGVEVVGRDLALQFAGSAIDVAGEYVLHRAEVVISVGDDLAG